MENALYAPTAEKYGHVGFRHIRMSVRPCAFVSMTHIQYLGDCKCLSVEDLVLVANGIKQRNSCNLYVYWNTLDRNDDGR